MRFDWYQATVSADPFDVIDAVAASADARIEPLRPMLSYRKAVSLDDGRGTIKVLWEGNGDRPHVIATGDSAPIVADCLRSTWTNDHLVTRVDSCEDFVKPGLWDEWLPLLLQTADEKQIKTEVAGDWHRLIDGRTQYLGSRTSDLRLRMYEKGKQLLSQGVPASPDHVRLELQYKPKGPKQRGLAAIYWPEHYWGLSEWTSLTGSRLLGIDPPRVQRTERRLMRLDRTVAAFVAQYGSGLLQWVQEVHCGDWQSAGYDLECRIRGDNQQIERLRAA